MLANLSIANFIFFLFFFLCWLYKIWTGRCVSPKVCIIFCLFDDLKTIKVCFMLFWCFQTTTEACFLGQIFYQQLGPTATIMPTPHSPRPEPLVICQCVFLFRQGKNKLTSKFLCKMRKCENDFSLQRGLKAANKHATRELFSRAIGCWWCVGVALLMKCSIEKRLKFLVSCEPHGENAIDSSRSWILKIQVHFYHTYL